MNKTRVYRHEDTGAGAKVFYNLFLKDLDSNKPSLAFDIEKMPNEIYHDSKRTKVIVPPSVTTISFTFQETQKLMGLFVEAISTYMAAVRKKLYATNTLRLEMKLNDCDYNILFHAVNKKISGSGKEKNSARLIMSIFDKKNNEEILSIKLKKTKLIVLLQIVKSLYEEYLNKFSFAYEDIEGRRLPLVRVEDMVAIGEVWIHGREVQKFQDYIERVIFDFQYRVGDGREMFSYRQISAVFSIADEVAQINLTKYTSEHKVYQDEEGNTKEHSFIINSEAAAIFFLLLPRAIAFNLEDIEVYSVNHTNDDEEVAQSVQAHDPYYLEEKVDEKVKSHIDDGDFILNTIENQIVLNVDDKMKFDAKNRNGKISLAVRYRDFMIADENYKVGRTNGETGEYENVNKLTKCVIDLKLDWLYIFALCAESVHSNKEMKLNKHGNHSEFWKFKKTSVLGCDHYGIRVVTDPNNKVPAVLLIDHHVDQFGDYVDIPLPQTGGSRMRIPLFKEHIRTLLKGLISLSPQFENYYWMKKFPVYSDDYDEVTGEMSLGIRRFFNADKGEEVVSFGIIGKSSEQVYLTDNDRDTLFFSAYYRLMFGRWLQFSGEQISISFDGWLTDRFHEYKIEFDLEGGSGSRGSLPALAIVFATARNKQKLKQLKEIEAEKPEESPNE